MDDSKESQDLKEIADLKEQINILMQDVEKREKYLAQKVKQGDRSNWSYDDWQKKDGEGLIAMYKNEKSEYDSLLNKWTNSLNLKTK